MNVLNVKSKEKANRAAAFTTVNVTPTQGEEETSQ